MLTFNGVKLLIYDLYLIRNIIERAQSTNSLTTLKYD